MDAAKKRKAATGATLRKKPRRDKSEFVSVEVGMREFKKRLADSSVAAAGPAQVVEDITQDVKLTRARAKTKAAPAAAKKTTPVKKAAATTKKATAAAKKAAVEKKATPVKRTTRAASKMTLAEVKLQLEREQKERVESRIQSLHREAKPTAAAAPAPAAAVPVPVDVTTAPMTFASVGQKQSPVKPSVVPNVAQPAPATRDLTALHTSQMPVNAAPVSATTEPPSSPGHNEFIVDDMEEDLMFAMALEEVERKLAPPQQPPSSETVTAITDNNTLASVSAQAPVASPVQVKSSPVKLQTHAQPTEVPIATQSQQPTQTEQAAPAIVVDPDVLEEMERLRRENELLRRSNELLQAAATSPTQKEAAVHRQQNCLPEYSNSPRVKTDLAASPRATPSETSAAAPTARYLDLARCGSDQKRKQKRKQTVSSLGYDQHQGRTRDKHSSASVGTHSEQRNEADVSACNYEEGEPREYDDSVEAKKVLVAKLLPTQDSSELPTADASTTPSSTQCTPSREDSRSATEPVVAEPEPGYVREPPSPERERLYVNEDTAEHFPTDPTGSDDGDVSDADMSDVDEEGDDMEEDGEDDEAVTEENGAAPRTSTIDSGNYNEYKVRHEDDPEAFEDEVGDAVLDSSTMFSGKGVDSAPTASIPTVANLSVVGELDDSLKPPTPANSEILERTTAPSNTEDDEDDEDDDDEAVVVNRVKRREVIAPSSSESESDSESEEEASESDEPSNGNVLEAALKAAGGDSHRTSQKQSSSASGSPVKNGGVSGSLHKSSAAPTSMSSPSLPVKTTTKKRKTPSSLTAAKKAPSVKSSLLWPALDDFYDFLLDMSPRNVRASEQKRIHLQQYAGGKLPAQHSSIEDYCDVQLEGIMEELVASVSNTTDRRGGGGSGPTRHLPLSSVSPCGVQGPSTSSLGLSFGAIFSESGFTGNTSNSNDYILTFDASALGKKSSSDFMSGDLVLVRSPRWKNYEMCVFGVVLCDSVVAVGGKSSAGGKGGNGGSGDSGQICVLIRAQKRDRDDAVENFSVLTELCLSNQRAPNWRWALQQVHNTTTSAREFQAIKSISFLPNDLKQALLCGQLAPSSKREVPKKCAASSSILSPRLLKYLQKHYNESQMQAILGCLGEDSRVIIQGPPGTGKTKTILGLLSALLDGAGISTLQKAKGTARIRVGASLQSARTSAVSKTVAETSIRVLVCAPSNAAVDELVVRVLSEGLYNGEKGESYRPRIVRVGRPESSQQLSSFAAAREASESKKNRKKLRKYAREVEEVLLESLVTKHRSTFPTVKQARQAIIKNAQIVFCTLSGAGSVAMCEFAQDFDALIIDEAAQAVEASTLIPFKFRPHRVVLVGDHRQLPATVISKKLVSMGYDRSLQQRLVENKSPVLLLTQQYRMHPDIAEFPSAHFYGGRLVQDDNMRNWTAQDYHRDRAFKPLLFLDVQGAQSQVSGSTSLRNMSEVETVVQLLRRLLKKFPHIEWKKRIGVIAPYKQQIYEVRGAIGKLESEFDRPLGIEVNTVDGFQGREKEIIIYSCVRTSHGGRRKKKRKSHGNDEEEDVLDAFWADERRMNVAITRAKSSLWIVGNSSLLKQSRAWRALIQHTKDHNRYIADSATSLFAANPSTRKTSKTPGK